MMKAQYLEVVFGDNDFGWPVRDALMRLWGYINENNGHIVVSVPEIFQKLHKAGSLHSLFERLYMLEYLALEVEFQTRGLYYNQDKMRTKGGYRPRVMWKNHRIENSSTIEFTNNYLDFEFRFHANNKFIEKGQNGEHAWLDLNNGESDNF